MAQNEDGFLTGAMSGAASGAATGAAFGGYGAAVGAVVGLIGGGLMGNSQSDKARRAQIDAQKAAEAARRASIVKQMGAQQQAENIAFAGLTSKSGAGKPAGGSPEKPGGLMGQNLTTSGTF